jgi:hypothetical protein
MRELLRIDGDFMKAQKQHQHRYACVGQYVLWLYILGWHGGSLQGVPEHVRGQITVPILTKT